tara:strand:- start:1811 stop:1960 length:150 start_codon:yes stop_codon:yes gene_type:complete
MPSAKKMTYIECVHHAAVDAAARKIDIRERLREKLRKRKEAKNLTKKSN